MAAEIEFAEGQVYTAMPSTSLPEKREIHIVAVIENNMVVFKFEAHHKRGWMYFVEHRNNVQRHIERATKK